ncbi:MAG: hypothetical protein ACKPCQ_16255 [Dolichospermum sp.]
MSESGILSPITHYPLPITHYPLPITHYQLPITHYPLPTLLWPKYSPFILIILKVAE